MPSDFRSREKEIMQIEHILLPQYETQYGNETANRNETLSRLVHRSKGLERERDVEESFRDKTPSGNETREASLQAALRNETLTGNETLWDDLNPLIGQESEGEWNETLLEKSNSLADIIATCGSPIDLTGMDSPIESFGGAGEKDKKPKRKTKVFIKDPDMQTLLIRMCITHFPELEKGTTKKKFWEMMRDEYRKETGIDAIVMGFMKSWEEDRRKAVEAEKWKSGVAKANTDKDQALDIWIGLMNDFQKTTTGFKGKKKDDKELEREKQVSDDLRNNMSTILSRKRKVDTFGEGSSRKKAASEGNMKMMETILSANELGDDKMMSKWSEIEKEKMDRYERVMDRRMQSSKDEQRKQQEFQNLSDRVDRVLDLLEKGQNS